MHVSAQQVDGQIHGVTDDKYQGEENGAYNSSAQHTAHLVEDGSDYACGQPQSQQSE